MATAGYIPNNAMVGGPRYQPKPLVPIFGHDNSYQPVVEVELATISVLAEMGFIADEDYELLTPALTEKLLAIPATLVDATERSITKHDIRALVEEMKKISPLALHRLFHIILTSYDPIESARTLQYTRAHQTVVEPMCRKVLGIMIKLVRKFAGQLQIGRTHGRHALPITVGFWLATILHRLHYNYQEMCRNADRLVGKLSGAVGAYNAQIGFNVYQEPGQPTFEERVLARLGLKPSRISTQILPPEALAYYLVSLVFLSGAFAQFGTDCRQLMRDEINEITEDFGEEQSGSSTMAHKRNPVNFEQLVGMYSRNIGEIVKVFLTMVSEHQRDLTGSSVVRDFPAIVTNLVTQLTAMIREDDILHLPFLERIKVNADACERNFQMNANVILSEPIYIAIQLAGYQGDGHKLVNHVFVPQAIKENRLLVDVAAEYAISHPGFQKAWDNIPREMIELFHHPENYTGIASEKALQVADDVERELAAA